MSASDPLVDDYLEFLEGRCRPNTVLAAASDLRVFFAVVGKPPDQVQPADMLGFISAQRTGRCSDGVLQSVDPGDATGGWPPARWRVGCRRSRDTLATCRRGGT